MKKLKMIVPTCRKGKSGLEHALLAPNGSIPTLVGNGKCHRDENSPLEAEKNVKSLRPWAGKPQSDLRISVNPSIQQGGMEPETESGSSMKFLSARCVIKRAIFLTR